MARPTIARMIMGVGMAGGASLWGVVSGLLLTPLILSFLGIEGYGVWVLIFGITAPMTLMGVSFGSAYTKFTAELEAKQQFDELNELIGSGVAVVGAVGLVVLTGLWFAGPSILSGLRVPDALLGDARVALMMVATSLVLTMSIGCVRHILAGLQRTDLDSLSQVLSSLIYLGVGIVLVSGGYGLRGLGFAYLTGEMFAIALVWHWCKRTCPPLRIAPWLASRAGARRAASLGGRFQALFLLGYLGQQGFGLILSALLGPAVYGVFEIGNKIIGLSLTATRALNAPIMPAFAHMHSDGDVLRARQLLLHGGRALYVGSMISLGFAFVFADKAIQLWTGDAWPLATWTVRVLAFVTCFKQLSAPGTLSMRGRGIFGLELQGMTLQVVVRALLVAPFYLQWGYEGFVLSQPFALTAATLFMVFRLPRYEPGFEVRSFLLEVFVRPSMFLIPLILGFDWLQTAIDLRPAALDGRWALAAELSVWGLLYGIPALAISWFLILSSKERTTIGERLARATGRVRTPAEST